MNRSVIASLMIGIAFLLVEGTAQTQNRTPQAAQPGRYQLFSAEHAIIGITNAEAEKVILRIDTATGKVDEWNIGQDAEGKVFDEWTPTGELPRKR